MGQTFHNPSVSLNKTPMKGFGSSNVPLRQKKPIKFEICGLFGSSKQIEWFFGSWFGNQHSVLAQTVHSSSVSPSKTPVRVFRSRSVPFRQKKPIKCEIYSIFSSSKEIDQLWGVWFGNQHSVWSQLLHSPSELPAKTPMKVFRSINILFRKKKPLKFEICTLFSSSKQIDQFL